MGQIYKQQEVQHRTFKLSAERLVTSTYVITDETTKKKLVLDKIDRYPMADAPVC